MRIILILILSLSFTLAHGQALFHDPLSLTFDRIKDAADKIWQNKQDITNSKILAQAISTYNLLNDTRQITGMVVSTTKEFKDLTKRFQDDLRSLSDLTGDNLKELNALQGWRDALQGKGYQSLVDLDEYYEANTASLRGSDGQLNFGNALINSVSDQDFVNADRGFKAQQNFYRRMVPMNYDYQVREKLKLAKEKENEARLLTMKLNMKAFGKKFIALGDALKKEGESTQPQQTDTEITNMAAKIRELLADASRFRNEAMVLMGYNLAHQTKSYKSARDISIYRDKTFLEYQQMKYLEYQLNPNWSNPYQDSYYYDLNPTYDLSFK